jgi:hypothetical protein
MRSLIARRSICAAQALTARTTSAGPLRSKPSATVTSSTPVARSSSTARPLDHRSHHRAEHDRLPGPERARLRRRRPRSVLARQEAGARSVLSRRRA